MNRSSALKSIIRLNDSFVFFSFFCTEHESRAKEGSGESDRRTHVLGEHLDQDSADRRHASGRGASFDQPALARKTGHTAGHSSVPEDVRNAHEGRSVGNEGEKSEQNGADGLDHPADVVQDLGADFVAVLSPKRGGEEFGQVKAAEDKAILIEKRSNWLIK